MKNKKTLIKIVSILLIFVLAIVGKNIFSSNRAGANQKSSEQQTTAVVYEKPMVKDVVDFHEFTGYAEAVESVDIRARVEGFLESANFEEGSFVNKGDLLFVIERDSYQSKYEQAKANLQASEAELKRANLDLERVEKAVETNAVSKQEVSTKQAERDKASAGVMADRAMLKDAELQLSYTTMYSPINGKVSRKLVDVGNLVGAGEKTLLATVVQMDPIYVYFNVSETVLLEGIKNLDNSKKDIEHKFFIGLADEQGYSYEGVLDYIDNTIDSGTGTITFRGTVANKDKVIYPGMYVRVKVPAATEKNSVLVKEKAICTDLDGKSILVINDRDVIERRQVKLGIAVDQYRVILQGLMSDESYISTSLQFLRPGMKVKPAPEQASANEDSGASELK